MPDAAAGTPREIGWEDDGLVVAALSWGPEDAPLALCLHGYPDTAWTWRHLGPELAGRGWCVVAPFLRGYAPTGLAPDGAYQVGALVHDALEARSRFHRGKRSVLIGHDWGAIVAHATGASHPEAFERIVTLAVPPFGPFLRSARSAGLGATARQLRASGYTTYQQIPRLSERALPRVIPELWRAWSPGYDAGEEDLTPLEPTLADPARRTAILSYYRDFIRPWRWKPAYREHQRHFRGLPPGQLLFLYGRDDGCLRREVVEPATTRLLDHHRVELFDGVGHFLHLEQPKRVNQAIVDFVGDA